MSNVLERYRKISAQEFYRNAEELRDDMMKFMLREKNVPRKYRGVTTYPLKEHFDELFRLIKEANKVYADSEEKVNERRRKQQLCIDKVDDIYYVLQETVSLLWKDKLRSKEPSANQQRLRNALNDFALRLKREEDLLIGWKEGTRFVKPRGKKK